MTARVTSALLFVEDIVRSIEFYNEIVGAEIAQVHAEEEGGPITLAILKIGEFTLMLQPQGPIAGEFEGSRVGLGIHLQIRVEDVNLFHEHCINEGALLSVSGDPVDQAWGWREFALKDPDGYVWSVYQDLTGGQWT